MPDENEQSASQAVRGIIDEMTAQPAPAAAPAKETPPNPAEPTPAEPVAPEKPKGEATPAFDMSTIDIPPEVLDEKKQTVTPPAEPPVEEEPDEIKNANQKTRHAFAQLRHDLTLAKDELKKLRETKPTTTPGESTTQVVEQVMQARKQAEDLQAKLDQAYDQLGKFSLSADPRFQAKYQGPQNAILDQIKVLGKEWDIKDEDIDSFLKASPKQRVALLNEKAPDLTPMLSPLFAQYDHIERLKQMDLANHKELRQALDAEQAKHHAVADQTGRIEMFKQAAAKVLKDGHFVFKTIEGNDEWNKNVAVLQQNVQSLFTKDNPQAQSEAMILGIAAPVYLAMFKKERAARLSLEDQLKKRYGVKPSLGGDSTPTATRPNPDGMTSKQAVHDLLHEELSQ